MSLPDFPSSQYILKSKSAENENKNDDENNDNT